MSVDVAPRRRLAAPAGPPSTRRRRPPGWVVGAVAYAASWPLVGGLNASWLAWGAFVPLLLEVERHERFGAFAWRVLAFMGLAGIVSCWWWFFEVPAEVRALAWVGGAHEIALSSVPLLLLYPLARALGVRRALLALVAVWPLWEWAYSHWELSISSILLGYTQAQSVWLIQFAELFGVGSVTAWVVAFNVLLALAYREHGWTPAFRRRALRVAAVLVAVPLAYGAVRGVTVAPADAFRVAAVHTDFEPLRELDGGARISRTTHLSDSVAYYAARPPDLYVWPEGGVAYAWTAESRPFVERAVADWGRPLLTGYGGLEPRADGDSAQFNRAVLLAPGADDVVYDKRRPMPVREGLPHADLFEALPGVAEARAARQWMTPGRTPTLLPVETAEGRTVRVAAPICHEQQFPALWTDWVRAGADVFVVLAFESWFGDRAFHDHFLGIARVRAIEHRRSVVRVSNGGPTAVIDALGRVTARAEAPEGALTETVRLYRGTTLYARAPWLFPLLCVAGLAGLGAAPRRRRESGDVVDR